jgi:hypothetical protein
VVLELHLGFAVIGTGRTVLRRWDVAAAAIATVAGGCATHTIPLRAMREPAPVSQALEVVASTAGAPDPLPVSGAHLAYSGVALAAGRLVAAAAAPWAARHVAERPQGWQIRLELVRAEAEAHDGELTVEIDARVTMHATAGEIHLGQTHGYCKETGELAGGDGSSVVYRCLDRLSRDVAGWLEGLNP